MHYFEIVVTYLENLSTQVPVSLFVLVGSFIEEIIAPIPSPLVMTLSGSIAGVQGRSILFLFLLALIGTSGKMIGTAIFYFLASKMEDLFLDKFGRFLGVTRSEVEKIGENFSKGKKDFWVIFFARLIPIMPTSPVTVVSGILKLEPKSFFIASFLGYFGRGLIYLFLGYFAYESYESIIAGLDSVESIVQIIFVLFLMIAVVYFYYKRSRGEGSGILSKVTGKSSDNSTED